MREAQDHELLTQREIQILELIAQGFSAKEVAQVIQIAPRTVEGHIDTIRIKLHARNRTHMVTKAIAARFISIEGSKSLMPQAAPFIVPVQTVLETGQGGLGSHSAFS